MGYAIEAVVTNLIVKKGVTLNFSIQGTHEFYVKIDDVEKNLFLVWHKSAGCYNDKGKIAKLRNIQVDFEAGGVFDNILQMLFFSKKKAIFVFDNKIETIEEIRIAHE